MTFRNVMYWMYNIMELIFLITGMIGVVYGINMDNSTLRYLGLVSLIAATGCAIEKTHFDLMDDD